VTTHWRSAGLALVLVAVGLAGCSQAEAPKEVEIAPGETVTVSEAPRPSLGTVSGIVGDDALYPLAGVEISILGLNMTTTTRSGGQFVLVNVPAGLYILEGELKDHATAQTTVDVQPDKVARAVLLLARLPATDPYHTTFKQDAFVDLSVGTLFVGSYENVTMEFTLDPSKAVTLVAESKWDGTIETLDGKPLSYDLQGTDLRSIMADSAANPFSLRIDARVLPPRQDQFTFTAGPRDLGPQVMLESTGTLFMTIFYNEAAPDGWSMLAGGT
jgi:hypothetical protein